MSGAAPVAYKTDGSGLIDKANPDTALLVGLVWIQVVYVTMVYGPIAAFLVEYFRAKVRYTSLSIPYHFGNGWFGGLLPLTLTGLVGGTIPIATSYVPGLRIFHLRSRHNTNAPKRHSYYERAY